MINCKHAQSDQDAGNVFGSTTGRSAACSTAQRPRLWNPRTFSKDSKTGIAECQEILGKQAKHGVPFFYKQNFWASHVCGPQLPSYKSWMITTCRKEHFATQELIALAYNTFFWVKCTCNLLHFVWRGRFSDRLSWYLGFRITREILWMSWRHVLNGENALNPSFMYQGENGNLVKICFLNTGLQSERYFGLV